VATPSPFNPRGWHLLAPSIPEGGAPPQDIFQKILTKVSNFLENNFWNPSHSPSFLTHKVGVIPYPVLAAALSLEIVLTQPNPKIIQNKYFFVKIF